MPANDEAALFDPAVQPFGAVLELFRNRVHKIEPDEVALADAHLSLLIQSWGDRAAQARSQGTPLLFDGTDLPQFDSLLCSFDNRLPDRWPTLNSMRHVDKECSLHVFGTAV